jgi:hypothetical protein
MLRPSTLAQRVGLPFPARKYSIFRQRQGKYLVRQRLVLRKLVL